LLPLLAALYLMVMPDEMEISKIRITRNDKTQNVTLPYLADMDRYETFSLSFSLILKNENVNLNIIPVGCIMEILINGKKIPLENLKGLCDYSRGINFDFSQYVQKGFNHFNFRIRNSVGGSGSINVVPYEGRVNLSFLYYVFALLALASVALIFRKLKFAFAIVQNWFAFPQLTRAHCVLLFILIFLLSAFLRAWGFGEYPAGLNQDEAIMAYDAYADLTYGMDQNGNHNSVYNVSYGHGQSMGYNYIMRPFIDIFGLNITAVRLPMLILSLISLLFFYLLLMHICGVEAALIGLFLLALNPWHIMLSRWALDCNLAPLIFLPAIYFIVIAHKKPIFFIFGMFLLGLSCYGYAMMLMFYSAFIPIMIWHMFQNKTIPKIYAIPGFLIFGLVSAPLVLWWIINTFDYPAFDLFGLHIPRMTVLRSTTAVNINLDNFKYFGEFILTGNDGLISNAISPFGPFYPFMLAFIFYGIYVLFAKFKGRASEMKFWLISAVILALAINININRINMIFFPLIFAATLGIAEVQKYVKSFVPVLATLIIITTAAFVDVYLTSFNENNQYLYFDLYEKAIEYAVENSQQNATIYISGVSAPYVFALYATKMSPQHFINTVVYSNPDGKSRYVLRFDRFVNGLPNTLNKGEIAIFHVNEENHNLRNEARKVTAFGNFLVVEN